jgi:hypothetical protein
MSLSEETQYHLLNRSTGAIAIPRELKPGLINMAIDLSWSGDDDAAQSVYEYVEAKWGFDCMDRFQAEVGGMILDLTEGA